MSIIDFEQQNNEQLAKQEVTEKGLDDFINGETITQMSSKELFDTLKYSGCLSSEDVLWHIEEYNKGNLDCWVANDGNLIVEYNNTYHYTNYSVPNSHLINANETRLKRRAGGLLQRIIGG